MLLSLFGELGERSKPRPTMSEFVYIGAFHGAPTPVDAIIGISVHRFLLEKLREHANALGYGFIVEAGFYQRCGDTYLWVEPDGILVDREGRMVAAVEVKTATCSNYRLKPLHTLQAILYAAFRDLPAACVVRLCKDTRVVEVSCFEVTEEMKRYVLERFCEAVKKHGTEHV